jgi:hypothetical protein
LSSTSIDVKTGSQDSAAFARYATVIEERSKNQVKVKFAKSEEPVFTSMDGFSFYIDG